jgi:hypothetical protein
VVILSAGCTTLELPDGHSTVLPEQTAHKVAQQCSRSGPPSFEGTWTPEPVIIARLEQRIASIRKLRAAGCCTRGARITSLDGYYLQYVGVIANGRRLIYVNAFTANDPSPGWRSEPMMVCDGGTGSWGVMYDPEAGVFFDLAVNGSA